MIRYENGTGIRMQSPSIGQHHVVVMNLFHCDFLDDLISDDNPFPDVIVYLAAECVLRL